MRRVVHINLWMQFGSAMLLFDNNESSALELWDKRDGSFCWYDKKSNPFNSTNLSTFVNVFKVDSPILFFKQVQHMIQTSLPIP